MNQLRKSKVLLREEKAKGKSQAVALLRERRKRVRFQVDSRLSNGHHRTRMDNLKAKRLIQGRKCKMMMTKRI